MSTMTTGSRMSSVSLIESTTPYVSSGAPAMMNWNGWSWYLVKQLAFCCWVAPPQSDGASGPSCLSCVS